MNAMKLTSGRPPAHNAPMKRKFRGFGGAMRLMVAAPVLAVLPGCITIKAPEDKIVIELNINIKQEVLYKIENDVQKAVEQNSGIF